MNHTRNITKHQPPTNGDNRNTSRREILEKSKISRLPPLPERRPTSFDNTPSAVAVRAVCAGCNARLDLDDQIQKLFTGCRRCIAIYGRLDAAFAENAERKKKQMLEKMGGVK